MFKRRFAIIKNFSIPARLHTAGALALAGLLITGGAGYIGLTQSNDGLTASITATSAVLNQKQADMMHDALRADVLFALMTGPHGAAQLRSEIQADVAAHSADFTASIDNLTALDLADHIRAEVVSVLPLLKDYTTAAQEITNLALSDQAAGQAKWNGFMDRFLALEDSMGVLGESIAHQGNSAGVAAQERNLLLLNILLGALATCALVMITSNFLLARSITTPIRRVKDAVLSIVNGDLYGRQLSLEHASDLNDEVSEIAAKLEILRMKLREAVEMEAAVNRTQADQQVVVGALSVGLQNLSQGTLTQTLDEPFSQDYEGLRGNFNTTVERLNQTISQVAQASRSIRSWTLRSATRSAWVARSAASPAMCTSTSARTSCTCSNPNEPPRRNRLMDSVTAAASTAATRRPLPERTSITPFATRARTASRTTVRETPNCSPSSRSDGSRSPT